MEMEEHRSRNRRMRVYKGTSLRGDNKVELQLLEEDGPT